jgi:hypothetical protein
MIEVKDSYMKDTVANKAPEKQNIIVEDIRISEEGAWSLVGEQKLVENNKNPTEKEKALSRAERRKKIKAEIMEGSEEEGFKGYRRRMW